MKSRRAGSGGEELQAGSMLDSTGRLPSNSILFSEPPFQSSELFQAPFNMSKLIGAGLFCSAALLVVAVSFLVRIKL